MSYIRSGSNPEKLYIWGDKEDVCISHGLMKIGDRLLHVPHDTWEGFLKKCGDDFLHLEDEITYKGLSVTMRPQGAYLMYQDWVIEMYYSTWRYLVDSNQSRYEPSLKRFLYRSWFWISGIPIRLRYGF